MQAGTNQNIGKDHVREKKNGWPEREACFTDRMRKQLQKKYQHIKRKKIQKETTVGHTKLRERDSPQN